MDLLEIWLFSIHMKAITKSSMFNLKQIARIKGLLTRQDSDEPTDALSYHTRGRQ